MVRQSMLDVQWMALKFARESLGLHVEKKNIGDVIKKVRSAS